MAARMVSWTRGPRTLAISLALGFVLVPEPGRAQVAVEPLTIPAALDSARTILETFREERGVPGMTAAIAVNGELVWTEGFGYANLQHQVEATSETRWRIASISKPFAAVNAYQLAAEGRLDLDAPIQRWLPEFPEKRGPVTMQRLMSHTAGIRHYRGNEFASYVPYDDVVQPIAVFADDTLLFEPGTRYSYSTYGFTLVSAVVSRAAGKPWLQVLEERITRPLLLGSIGPEKRDSIILHHASFYERDSLGVVTNALAVDLSNKWAGGGLVSTAADLVRFALGVMDHRVLSEDWTERMWANQVLADGDTITYTQGWRVSRDEEGRRVVSHTGGAMGGGGVLVFYPDHGVAVAILGNLGTRYAQPGNRIAAMLVEASG